MVLIKESMPKLTSGLKFDLDFLSEFPEGMRTPEYEALWQHVCDSASNLRHLYPILSVIFYGSKELAKDNIVKLCFLSNFFFKS